MYKPYTVLLTSVPLAELKTACIALGVNEFCSKPVDNLQLEKILKENNLISFSPGGPSLDKQTWLKQTTTEILRIFTYKIIKIS